jgi:Na+/melibiose symporter-like transporter
MEKAAKKEQIKVKKERHGDSVGFGQLMIWQSRMISVTIIVLINVYIMIYCTDTLGIPAVMVSFLLVLSKVIDGVTDMVAGFIVDRTKTRWGKARPYEIFVVGLWLTTWLLFTCPEDLSVFVKCVWIFIMYTLANAVCYTFLNANSTPYTVRAFRNEQIVKLTSYGSAIPMIAAVIFNVAFPMMMGSIATSPAGWSRLIAMWAVPMAAIGLLRMLFVKEKYDVESPHTKGEKLKISHVSKLFKTNKYILIVAMMNFIFNFVTNMGVIVYYYTYIVKNVGLMGVASLAQVIAIPMAFVFPQMLKKMSVAKLMTIGFIISSVGYLINFVAGANMILLIIGGILTGAGTIPASMLLGLLIIECAEFNEWKGQHRMEGTMSSIVGLGQKVGAALGSGALGVFLSIAGYTGSVETMPDSAYMMIRLLFSLVPMALFVITIFSLKAYNLDKLLPQVREENKTRREEYDTRVKRS